jgi:hypothetical protein
MRRMERFIVDQPVASEPSRTDPVETGKAGRESDTRLLGHTILPGLGSGPIFPFSEIFSWVSSFFKRITSSHEAP